MIRIIRGLEIIFVWLFCTIAIMFTVWKTSDATVLFMLLIPAMVNIFYLGFDSLED